MLFHVFTESYAVKLSYVDTSIGRKWTFLSFEIDKMFRRNDRPNINR